MVFKEKYGKQLTLMMEDAVVVNSNIIIDHTHIILHLILCKILTMYNLLILFSLTSSIKITCKKKYFSCGLSCQMMKFHFKSYSHPQVLQGRGGHKVALPRMGYKFIYLLLFKSPFFSLELFSNIFISCIDRLYRCHAPRVWNLQLHWYVGREKTYG